LAQESRTRPWEVCGSASRSRMLLLASLLAAVAGHQPTRLQSLAEFDTNFNSFAKLPQQYHTYERLLSDVRALAPACEKAGVKLSFSSVKDGRVTLDVVHLTTQPDDAGPHFKVGAAFGEHSRELISPETSLVAIRSICGDKGPACVGCEEDHSDAQQSLLQVGAQVRGKPMQWSIVMNGNPLTRQKLEKTGNFCLRLDQDGVDPNRNYDDHFDAEGDHGPRAFSQPETRALRNVLEDLKPNAYFSIHSGELGLYGPHAWTTAGPDAAFAEFKVLDEVKSLCPDCPVGPAGKLQGRPLTGSSFDYARDNLKADYSYAFEVFIDPTASPSEPDGCFRYFNPATQDAYQKVTNRFATVFLQTAHLSHDNSRLVAGDATAAKDEQATIDNNMRTSFSQNPAEPFLYREH